MNSLQQSHLLAKLPIYIFGEVINWLIFSNISTGEGLHFRLEYRAHGHVLECWIHGRSKILAESQFTMQSLPPTCSEHEANANHMLEAKLVADLLFRLRDNQLSLSTLRAMCNVLSALLSTKPTPEDILRWVWSDAGISYS